MVQRCKFSIELKNFPPDLSGEPINLHNDVQTTCIHLPQIVLKKRILIANYLTIRILFGAANGIRTRDPQLGKLMLYQLSYCRISKTETKVIYIFQPTKYKQTIFTITIKISALLFISTALCISCVWINRSLSPIKGL